MWGDYDNDGDLDLFLANYGNLNYLFENTGSSFQWNQVLPWESYQSISASWIDYDNDGFLDLYIVNEGQDNQLFHNDGDGTFTDVTDEAWPLGVSDGVVWADYDNDGDLDLAAPNVVIRNDLSTGNHWLDVHLMGTCTNTSAIGARISLTANGLTQTREISGKEARLSQGSLIAHFGMGPADLIDTLQIRWPSGYAQTMENISSDQVIEIREIPAFQIEDAFLTEGDEGMANMIFTVSLCPGFTDTVTVEYSSQDITSEAGVDYESVSGTLTFEPGVTEKTFVVPIIGDTLPEPMDSFLINLFNPVGAYIKKGQATGFITNDDGNPPSIKIGNVKVMEGDESIAYATFEVWLSFPVSQAVSVDYTTEDGTATLGLDYQGVSGTLVFQPNETTLEISVPVIGDTYTELSENFHIRLSNEKNAYLLDGDDVGTCFIIDDEAVSSALSQVPALVNEGNQASADYGWAVASAGDVNGDGFEDVLVGAPFKGTGGMAYLYLGSSDGLVASPAWIGAGPDYVALYGWSVASAGDVNNDGYGDVIVGAPWYQMPSQHTVGAVFVYLGSAEGLSQTPSWIAYGKSGKSYGTAASGGLGYSVATAGDVNNDGYDDIIVGDPYFGTTAFTYGTAHVWLGSSTGIATNSGQTVDSAGWTASGVDESLFGASVGTAGDVNGDGYSDIVVGAPKYLDTGRAFVWLGGRTGADAGPTTLGPGGGYYDSQFHRELQSDLSYDPLYGSSLDLFGWSVGTAGDVNGDGFSDIVIGAPGYYNWRKDPALRTDGRVFVYYGSESGISATADWDAFVMGIGRFGYSVKRAGDVNNDGYDDIVVGDRRRIPGSTTLHAVGRAFLYTGSEKGLVDNPCWMVEDGSEQFNAIPEIGNSMVAGVGDVNGDGYDDLAVGSPGYSNNESSEGALFIYYGDDLAWSVSPAWIGNGSDPSSSLGSSVASGGDVNGDGYPDLLVGAPDYPNNYGKGMAYLYLGTASGFSDQHAWSTEGVQDNERFGASVAFAGDVNGDGYMDAMVGAPGEGKGTVYLYLGSESGLSSTPDWSASGTNDDYRFGFSVASAGDVNGDGYDDVVIGAPGPEYFETRGTAYVYFGSASGLGAEPGWTFSGEQSIYAELPGMPVYGFGYSVAPAGDVNNDGYGDIIVGFPSYNSQFPAGSSGVFPGGGKIYVFFGTSSGLPDQASWTAWSHVNTLYTRFGWSVCSAGDVNRDGYEDIMTGAPGYAEGGQIFIWHGSETGLGGAGSSETADWSVAGTQSGEEFGYAR